MITAETITARIEALRTERANAVIALRHAEPCDEFAAEREAARLDALVSEADMDLAQAEDEENAITAAVEWLTLNVTEAQWETLVGSQNRREFATPALERNDDIETVWADYLLHAESM